MRLNPRLTHSSLMLVDREEGEEELEEGEEEEVQLLLSVVAFQCKYNPFFLIPVGDNQTEICQTGTELTFIITSTVIKL